MAGLLNPLVDGLGDVVGGLLGTTTSVPTRNSRPAPTPLDPEPPALAPEPIVRTTRPLLVLNPERTTGGSPVPDSTPAPSSSPSPANPAGPLTTLTPNTDLTSPSSTTSILSAASSSAVDAIEVLPSVPLLVGSTSEIPAPSNTGTLDNPLESTPPLAGQNAGSSNMPMQPAVMAAAIAAPVVAIALIGIVILVWKTQRRTSRRNRASVPYDEEFESLKKKHEEKFGVGHNY